MGFFWIAKVFFLVYNLNLTGQLTFQEIAGIFGHGLIMDVSTACYLLLVPGLITAFRSFLSSGIVNLCIKGYTVIVSIIASVLLVIDLGLYPHWGTRVNLTAFNYIDDPVAMSASVSLVDVLLALLVAGSLIFVFLYSYRKLFPEGMALSVSLKWYASLFQVFLVATLILPIRGGLDTSPLNLSSVAFSQKLYVNQASCNFLWNFGNTIEKYKKLSSPCQYMAKDESVRLFKEFMENDTISSKRQLIHINPEKQPNVILIILESFSNKVISQLGGMHGIAPNLDSLCTKSIVFSSFYSTGNRSDRGISAVLGGYPSLLSTSIMVYPEKANSLTLLPEYFNRKNYNTSFYYGGDINFYNLKTFVLQSKCGKMVAKSDFPVELGQMSKWGVPDEYIFNRALNDLKTEKEPFMKTIYTVSSHPPFDVPYSKIKGNSIQEKYLNSVAYTDSCLGTFIDEFRKSTFWENTLLIVTADHGTMQPGPTDITDPASYLIPLIWTGGLVDSIQRIETITMQSDFPISLIHQLGWKADSSRFSKDFFSSKPFAFYMLDSGWGYIVPEGKYYFDQNLRGFKTNPLNASNPVDLTFPKAFMQVLHDDFINR